MYSLDTFRTNMKKIREAKGITLKEIADAIGVKESTVQRYESGKGIKSIPYESIIKIAEVLECNPTKLVGWEETKKIPSLENKFKQGDIEGQLLYKFNKLSESNQKVVLDIIDSLLKNQI